MPQIEGSGLNVAILDDYQGVALSMADWSSLGPDCTATSLSRKLRTIEEAAEALAETHVVCLMRERTAITRALLERLPRLRLIVATGSRIGCVDLEAAAERGVTVSLTGAAGGSSASELAMALILAAARRIPQEDRHLRQGGWQQGVGMTLEGRTLGLLGLGRQGARVARLGQAFGMETVAWSPNLTPRRAAEHGATCMERDAFFAAADVISVHMVLAPATRGLVGRRELALMKRSAILVNTSRGPVVDEAALIEALTEGRIGMAALDVFDEEPLPAGHPLTRLGNTVLTPHIGFVNDRAYRFHYRATVGAIAAWRAGAPVNVLTP